MPGRGHEWSPKRRKPALGGGFPCDHAGQGRQDSNLQPPVLETGALPIELRPSGAARDCIRGSSGIIRAMGGFGLAALFSVLTVALAGIAYGAATAGRWVIAVAAAVIAAWMGSLALSVLRRMRR